MDTESVTGLSYLEDGEFAKIYKGQFAAAPQGKKLQVVIKAPRVGEQIRKEKSEWEMKINYICTFTTFSCPLLCHLSKLVITG